MEPKEVGVPQFEDAPGEKATPNVDVGIAGEVEMDTDGEWNIDNIGKEDYGLDEDRCKAYLKAMQVVMEKGRIVTYQDLTHRKELHLIRVYIQGCVLSIFTLALRLGDGQQWKH